MPQVTASACVLRTAPIRGLHAQVSRYPPHFDCDSCFNNGHALAHPSAAPSAGWNRQNCAPHRLCRSGPSAGTHRAFWINPRLCWRECFWWHHRAYPALLRAQCGYAGLDCGYCRRSAWNETRACLPQASEASRLNIQI